MNIQTVTSVYFSPTGTTRKLVNAVVKGMDITLAGEFDCTLPSVRGTSSPPITGDVLLVAMPVYALGLPFLVYPFIEQLKGEGKPAFCISVYGNMSEGIANVQLYRLLSKHGFVVVGTAAFIAEHSYSQQDYPVAAGRPNRLDIAVAEEYGRQFVAKLRKSANLSEAEIKPKPCNPLLFLIKQHLRYNTTRLYAKPPQLNLNRCNRCGLCVKRCPMGAIDKNTLQVNAKTCIHCSACVKCCSVQARTMRFRLNFPASRLLHLRAKKAKSPNICTL